METKNMLNGIVSLTVVVICVAAIMMPVLSDATKTEVTLTNEGIFNAISLDENSEHTIAFDYTNPDVLTIDDVEVDMSDTPSTYNSVTLAFSNDWFMRYVLDAGVILYKCGTSTASAIASATVSSTTSMSATISAGTATLVFGENTYEYTVSGSGVIIQSEVGDFVVKAATDTAYVNEDSVVYGAGRTDRALGTSGTSYNSISQASVADDVTVLYYSPQYVLSGTTSVVASENEDYVDIYELTGYTFNLVADEVEYTITYNQIFVPYQVTSELSQHLGDGEIALINAIPVLVIVSIVIAAVGLAITSRRD